MENNFGNFEEKLGHKWITDKQVVDAMVYVRSYVELNGGDPYDIDWFGKKPSHLPEDVSRAWDVVVQRADDEAKLGIQV